MGVGIRMVARREIITGLLVGVLLAALVLPTTLLIWGHLQIAVSVALAMLAACSIATAVAMLLPWLLNRLGKDPAFGSGPLATVVQDLLSILIYLMIAKRSSRSDVDPQRAAATVTLPQYGLAHRAEQHPGESAVPMRTHDQEGRAGRLLDERLYRAMGNEPRDHVDVGVLLARLGQGLGQDPGGGPVIVDGVSGVDQPCVRQPGERVDGSQPERLARRLEREADRRHGDVGSVDTDHDPPGARAGRRFASAGVRATMTGHGACAVTWWRPIQPYTRRVEPLPGTDHKYAGICGPRPTARRHYRAAPPG